MKIKIIFKKESSDAIRKEIEDFIEKKIEESNMGFGEQWNSQVT